MENDLEVLDENLDSLIVGYGNDQRTVAVALVGQAVLKVADRLDDMMDHFTTTASK